MNENQIALAVCSFVLGITAKYADLYNEHGLSQHFKGASFLSGIIWGLSGLGMIYFSPFGGLTYIAHILYWFQRVKLEYSNHATAGVMMILAGFCLQSQFLYEYRFDLIFVFLAYLVTGIIQKYFKLNYPKTKGFWRLRLRIYLIPLVYGILRQTLDPVIATGFGMIGCELITNLYRKYAADLREKSPKHT